MNFEKACSILGIDNHEEDVTIEHVKKQYRRSALKYHPDKNKEPDACAKFQRIHDAYVFCMKYMENNDDVLGYEFENSDYKSVLFFFLRESMKKENHGKLFYLLIEKISTTCERKAFELLEKVDKSVLIKIVDMINSNKDILHFSDSFLEKVRMLLVDKIGKDECIILNPLLDDLFDNNLYKLRVNVFIYIVPLWHQELVYDNSGSDIYVKCYPVLPENVNIDERNNLYVDLIYNIRELLEKEEMIFLLGRKSFSFATNLLRIMPIQSLVLKYQGISKMNHNNIYDVSKKSDIILNIRIV
jgi:hypothetical protein